MSCLRSIPNIWIVFLSFSYCAELNIYRFSDTCVTVTHKGNKQLNGCYNFMYLLFYEKKPIPYLRKNNLMI